MSPVSAHVHAIEPAESPLTPESWGKLGMWIFLAGDAMSFGGLLAGYGALRAGATDWPNPLEVLGINLTAFMTFLLICSSVTMVKALSAIRHGNQQRLRNFLLLTILGGLTFLGLQAYEWTHLITAQQVTFTSNPYGNYLFGTTFFVITGFHGAHVTGGVIYLSLILLNSLRGRYSAEHYSTVENAGLYWHFVDLVWILVFTFVYLIK
ncbi:MAG: cytochrome c oxidase subunit 3 [candidate division KSB1 bacterium]|nr:cytochrome c oxidase subunit 3 [candidate division KSB1 bacterium]MDZ7274807.1 cytochrome c oxidase subunit 3 [candidate division KSB1 bacterium]MDZ7285632.1 cytochrome c oxidase subunit 3 [candidate division KSB1 bacterium]MDZ7298664.1 cytochrome c oxidase subunit 3 [candidate division KSB1 bacterium]MDZ7308797.1 cytochrome c oxidase subunit 3 [candidate division KSB1 bacterium]